MPLIQTSRLSMWYERFEPIAPSDKAPILLVCGFSMQCSLWPEALIQGLRSQGYPVVVFDNRDVGLTERCSAHRAGSPLKIGAARLCGLRPQVPYTLDALADDTVALMDALGIERAHLVGMSMGGMIAQLVAIRHPQRILTLCSWSSMSGEVHELLVHPRIMPGLFRKPSADIAKRIEDGMAFWTLLGTKTWPSDPEVMREKMTEAAARTTDISGVPRQFAAIMASPSRRRSLQKIRVPALVIHGTADPMLPHRAGAATAAAIPGARFVSIPDYGHNLPTGLMPKIVAEIVSNTTLAD